MSMRITTYTSQTMADVITIVLSTDAVGQAIPSSAPTGALLVGLDATNSSLTLSTLVTTLSETTFRQAIGTTGTIQPNLWTFPTTKECIHLRRRHRSLSKAPASRSPQNSESRSQDYNSKPLYARKASTSQSDSTFTTDAGPSYGSIPQSGDPIIPHLAACSGLGEHSSDHFGSYFTGLGDRFTDAAATSASADKMTPGISLSTCPLRDRLDHESEQRRRAIESLKRKRSVKGDDECLEGTAKSRNLHPRQHLYRMRVTAAQTVQPIYPYNTQHSRILYHICVVRLILPQTPQPWVGIDYLDPKTLWPGSEATSRTLVWTGPSTLSTIVSVDRTKVSVLCPPTTIDGTPGSGPDDVLPTPCPQSTNFAFKLTTMAITSPIISSETPTTQTVKVAEPTQNSIQGPINSYQQEALGDGPWQIISAVLIASGIIVVNAILVMIWIDWRRRKRNRAEIEDLPVHQVGMNGPGQPAAPPKEAVGQVIGSSLSNEMGDGDSGAQGSLKRFVLAVGVHHKPVGGGIDRLPSPRIVQHCPPEDAETMGLHQHEQEKAMTELELPAARRSSMQSAHSKVSSLGHRAPVVDPAIVPPSPSEASRRDMEMCSMSPVSPSEEEEEEGLVSRTISAKKWCNPQMLTKSTTDTHVVRTVFAGSLHLEMPEHGPQHCGSTPTLLAVHSLVGILCIARENIRDWKMGLFHRKSDRLQCGSISRVRSNLKMIGLDFHIRSAAIKHDAIQHANPSSSSTERSALAFPNSCADVTLEAATVRWNSSRSAKPPFDRSLSRGSCELGKAPTPTPHAESRSRASSISDTGLCDLQAAFAFVEEQEREELNTESAGLWS
ncbi:hypothetical protein DOTSEDRAFT_32742 [Dothistroma septosporum NZE10]|uniref:Uncharacterized protein n=1 Tax=Dothistroma septosporum (strain NZE10 / CBS 128990) TaxID=675120 RepID=N1PRJ3_DOTSN|nr:hypothetical protein DOTSEDRAFT_32742 [Dothistroma septosporum NZE10]